MEKETANKYILSLIITFFIAIYIICLVYLFKKESEVSSIILLIIYQTMLIFYLIHKATNSNLFTPLQMFNSQSVSLFSFTPLKNSNGRPFNSSTKLPVTISNDAPMERPILNLRGYKTLSQICVSNKEICKEGLKVIIWNTTLIASILNFVSLLLFIMTYKHLYKEYKLDRYDTLPLSKKNEMLVKKFKIFLLVSMVLTLFLIMINAFDIVATGLIGQILVFLSFGIIITMLTITSYNVYIASEIFKLKNIKVISR